MPMLKFVKAALVIKTHGYKGDIVLKKDQSISMALFEECLEEGNAIFIEKDEIPVPFFISIDSLYFFDDETARLHLNDINAVESAREFIGNQVFFTHDCLLPEKQENLSPLFWKNYRVIDQNDGYIGIVIDFNEEIANNPLLVIKKDDKSLLIPYNENFIVKVLHDKKEIITQLPIGFLDLYY